MNATLSAFVAGVCFAIGLVVSEMTKADKVIGFLDLAGDWDPSLAFVMVGAIGFHAVTYKLVTKRDSPIFEKVFHLPKVQHVDGSLMIGATLFGIGWSLGGFCPGPAVVSLVTGAGDVVVFVIAMGFGMWLHQRYQRLI